MKKAIRQILILILMCSGVLMPFSKVYGEGEKDVQKVGTLHALSAVLMDGESGRVLYEKNAQEIRAMASTTKIMTCILVLENGNLEETAVTSSYAASMPKVHLGAASGEEFYVKDLLYSLMLESHNDAAVILAEHVAGSVQEFAERMNAKAVQIGCRNTWFITPNGLDAQQECDGEIKQHSTTAVDLARIMQYCIKESPEKEEFLEITRTPSYRFSDVKGTRTFSCTNHNAFLNMMDGALSGKTGFTSKAGYCYIGALERDGKTFIVALLGCGWPNNKSYKWADTRKLMEYGLENYSYHFMSQAELPDFPKQVLVQNGQSPVLGMAARTMTKRVEKEDTGILLREDEKIETSYQGVRALKAPVEAGQKIGEVIYKVNGETWRTEDVVITETIEKIDYPWCLKQTVHRLAAGAAQ